MTSDSPLHGGAGCKTLRPRWQELGLSAVRWSLAVLWLAWALLAWWSAPRAVEVDQAHDDIRSGRVTSGIRAEVWNDDQAFWGSHPSPHLRSDGLLLVWTTPSGQIRYTAPDIPLPPANLSRSGGVGNGARTEHLAQQLEAAQHHAKPTTLDYRALASATKGIAAVLMLLCLAVLVAGPRPIRGTRVFWFWVALMPFGVGVLAWLAAETPWDRQPLHRSRPGGGVPTLRPRNGGLVGFAILLAGSLAVELVVPGLRALLGPAIVPG